MGPDRFAKPLQVNDPKECEFYHSMKLKNGERVEGKWTIDYDRYLGDTDFRGKLVLDVGTASGGLAWAIEDRGGNVIGLDLDEDSDWDVIPSMHDNYKATIGERKQIVEALHRAWWYCHERNQSSARAVYCHTYDIPSDIGPVDVTMFGAILLHLRDPFRALQSASVLTRETIIVTEMLPKLPNDVLKLPVAKLMPQIEGRLHPWTWWHLTPELVVQMLKLLGFCDATVSYHTQQQISGQQSMYTVTAKRTIDFEPSRGF
jgi:hypothetical protein